MQHEALALHFEHDELHTGPNERLAAFEVEDEPLRRRFQRKSGKNWKYFLNFLLYLIVNFEKMDKM